MYLNGATPTVPAVDMTSSGVNLLGGDVMNVQLSYNGTTLALTITDATNLKTFSTSWTVNIPGTVGANTAYVGFTGGTGGLTAIQDVLNWTYSSAAPAATPTFLPLPGTYTSAQSVALSDTSTGATIYYTTNNTAPTTSSPVYNSNTPIAVNSNTTIQAMATAPGLSSSAVAIGTYVINLPPAATPTFLPLPGTYATAQSVALSDATTGATIYYTTDGSTPTTSSPAYNSSSPISVAVNTTINAIAAAPGSSNSAVASGVYVINLPAAATPTFLPLPGTYTSVQSVTLSDTTTGAVIHYTTDGSTPTASSAVFNSATPIAVSANTTIKAIATASGFNNSAVATGAYVINLPAAATPTFLPLPGTYATAQSVTLSDTTTGAVIHYTTDGSTPTASSAVFNSSTPIAVSTNTTIKAIAVATGFSNSAVASGAYVISTTPIAFVQVNSGPSTFQASNASVAVTYSLAQTAGNLNIVVVGWGDTTSSVSSVTDTRGNTYVRAVGPTSTTGLQQSIYYAKNIAAGSNTVTVKFNQAAGYPDVRILEYSGLSTSSTLDGTAAAVGNGTIANSGFATTTSANELIFGAGTTGDVFTSAGAGFAGRIINIYGNIAEDKKVTSTGSYNATATTTSSVWVMQVATFK